jgi:hypothetical protein
MVIISLIIGILNVAQAELVPSPLKQFNSGILAKDIQCKEHLKLVIKIKDSSPACVKPNSVARLIIYGWNTTSNESTVNLIAGQQTGSLLVKKIFSDYVEGLNFMEYPLAREEGLPITLHIGEHVSNGCTIELTLVKINDSTATFLKEEHSNRPCPICLSADTIIDTPNGSVNIKELNEGMPIFTQDISGNKYSDIVLKTGKTMVPPDHKMVHIVLDDNRELYGSPNHPTVDGRVFGELFIGDTLDSAKIVHADLIPYNETYTYDILPSGPTGFYWANEILIKSTLK